MMIIITKKTLITKIRVVYLEQNKSRQTNIYYRTSRKHDPNLLNFKPKLENKIDEHEEQIQGWFENYNKIAYAKFKIR